MPKMPPSFRTGRSARGRPGWAWAHPAEPGAAPAGTSVKLDCDPGLGRLVEATTTRCDDPEQQPQAQRPRRGGGASVIEPSRARRFAQRDACIAGIEGERHDGQPSGGAPTWMTSARMSAMTPRRCGSRRARTCGSESSQTWIRASSASSAWRRRSWSARVSSRASPSARRSSVRLVSMTITMPSSAATAVPGRGVAWISTSSAASSWPASRTPPWARYSTSSARPRPSRPG